MEYIAVILVACALAVFIWKKVNKPERIYPPSDPEVPEDLRGKQ